MLLMTGASGNRLFRPYAGSDAVSAYMWIIDPVLWIRTYFFVSCFGEGHRGGSERYKVLSTRL